jgi:VWFA-related protein
MRPLALVLAMSCVVAAQPTFRSGVELVTIDVVATSRDGKPVFDLRAGDFELLEDGVPQDIKAFEFINLASLSATRPLPPGLSANDVEPGGLFTVVVDEIGVQVDDIREIRRVTQKFFDESLQPNDYVAVVRSGATSGFFLTSDRTIALDAISQSTGRRERTLGVTQPGADVPAVVEGAATIESFGTGENGRNSFRVLLQVVEQLRHVAARRKAVLWFSRGGDLPSGYLESIELGRPVGRDDEVFTKLIDAARASNVAIYSFDPRGLQSAAAETGRDFEPFEQGVLRDLASATGGRSVLGNDLNAGLERIAQENRAYYLLGYEPVAKTGRVRARKLEVRTKAPGVSLLHRRIYMPGEGAKVAPPELLASPLPVRDLPIVLAPAVVALDKKKRGILVPFEIGRDLRDGTDVEYSAMALDPTGKMVARANGRGKAKDGRLVGEVGLPVESKAYQVRLAARALNPEFNGLAFATIRVPEGRAKEAECSGFVFEQPGARQGLRSFTRGQPITISTLVSAESLKGSVAFGLGPSGGMPQRSWPIDLAQPLANGLWRVALSLKAPLPGGNLEIRVMQDELLLSESCLAHFTAR